MYRWILIVFFVVSSFGCSEKNNVESLNESSLKTGNVMYHFLKEKQYDSVYNLFSNSFFKKYSHTQLENVFNDVKGKYGTVVDFELVETKTSTTIKDNKTEKTISNFYKVYYSNGFLAKEELSFAFNDTTRILDRVDGYTFDYFYPPHDSMSNR